MRNRIVLTMMAVMVAVAGTACGSGAGSGATPTLGSATVASTPVSPVSASPLAPTPAPQLRSRGWLVYKRSGDLYVGDLTTGVEQRFTTEGFGAGYAGRTGYESGFTVYFTSYLTPPPASESATRPAQVSRRRIDGGAVEHLFTFMATNASTDGEPLAHAVSVARDGSAIAYADESGVHRYDVVSGAVSQLLTNPCQTEPRPARGCTMFINPQWSPDGKWILVSKLVGEGSISVVVAADDPTSAREFPDVGGDHQSWSPDSRYFCAFNEIFAPGGAHVVSPIDGSGPPQHAALAHASGIKACVWDEFGRFAVADDSDGSGGADRVAAFPPPPGDNGAVYPLPPAYVDVIGWLPDGSGLLAQGLPPCSVCGERAPLVAALMLVDGTLRSVPFTAFSALGDGVVGAIPFVPPPDD